MVSTMRGSAPKRWLPVLLGLFASGAVAALAPPEIGIDRSGLSLQPHAVQEKTLSDIRALRATWFRDGPSSGSPKGVAAFVEDVRLAEQHGLKLLLNIVQLDEDYAIPLARNAQGWNAKPLSRIDLDRFARRLRALLGALKAAHLTVDAVEFGNEDDTSAYDADVPVGHTASPAEIRTWLRGYGAFLHTGARILHDAPYYPAAKIVTFGIAHGGDPKTSFANPAQIVAMLRNVDGVDDLDNADYHVDGYGTHVYPSPSDPAGIATRLLQRDIAALGRAKPIWITEFGFLDPTKFPNKAGETLPQAVTHLLAAFYDLARRVRFGPLMFYAYNSGAVDAAGRPSGLVDISGRFVPAAAALAARGR